MMRKLDANLNYTHSNFAVKRDAMFQYSRHDEQMVSASVYLCWRWYLQGCSVKATTNALNGLGRAPATTYLTT